MSRRTRYNNFVVYYTSEDVTDTDESVSALRTSMKTTVVKKESLAPKTNRIYKTKKRYKPGPASKTGKPRLQNVQKAAEDDDENEEEMKMNKRACEKPCPASKKKGIFVNGLPLSKIELPSGWMYDLNEDNKLSLQSPECNTYNSFSNAVSHLMQQNVGPTTRKRSYSTSSLRIDEDQDFGWFLRCTDHMHFDTIPYSVPFGLEGPITYVHNILNLEAIS